MIYDFVRAMRKDTIIKVLMVVVTVLSALWIVLLLYSESRTSSVSLIKTTRSIAEKSKPLTSMLILDTVKNISIEQGDTLNVRYEIVNTGLDSLFLFSINPDCGCTDYNINAKAAGCSDTLSLDMIVDTKGKIGENLIHVVIEANTPEKMYMIKLPFLVRSSNIQTDSLETKRDFRFSKMWVSEPKIIYSKIKNNYHKDILIALMTSCDCIDVTPRRLYIKSGERTEYVIKALPVMKGDYSEYVILSVVGTNHKVKVDVRGTVE